SPVRSAGSIYTPRPPRKSARQQPPFPAPGHERKGPGCTGRPGAARAAGRKAPGRQVLSGPRREVPGTPGGDGLEELEPVPVRVLAVEAAHSREPIIEGHGVPGVPQPPRPGVEPGHEQAGMRLARGPEALLHAEVELYAVAAEPAAAARGQRGRFRDLVHP